MKLNMLNEDRSSIRLWWDVKLIRKRLRHQIQIAKMIGEEEVQMEYLRL